MDDQKRDSFSFPKTKTLVGKLTRSFFWRLLRVFLWLDFALLLITGAAMLFWAERRCVEIVSHVEEYGMPDALAQSWLSSGNFTISNEPLPDTWYLTIHPYQMPFHHTEISGARQTDLRTFYRVPLPNTQGFSITLRIQGIMTVICFGGMALLFLQFISLLGNLIWGRRSVRNTLRPIQDLSALVARLTNLSSSSAQGMNVLAHELSKIDTFAPDFHIAIPETHKELRTLALAINDMLDRIQTSYHTQMQFVSDASHELRTPIAVIQGYANLLDRWGKSDPQAQQEAIDAIREESINMQNLIEQLLFLARGDNNAQPIQKEFFDLCPLLSDLAKQQALLTEEKTILSDFKSPIILFGDPALVKQMVRILLDNAVKYSEPNTRIWIRAEKMPLHIRLTIQDEGAGISPADTSRIFDRFFRADESRTRATGGTGLGLSIAHWIVTQHNGWFEVFSREGAGTRFVAVFPLADEENKME